MHSLEIKDLHVSLTESPEKNIVKGLTLAIKTGEVHAIMGPNGTGKSTLAKVIAGHPDYTITSGDVLLDGKSILEMEPDERARAGLFLAFQYPSEIPGVSIANFLRAALQAFILPFTSRKAVTRQPARKSKLASAQLPDRLPVKSATERVEEISRQ